MTLTELKRRVDEATGPDREIDCAIHWECSEWENLGGWWRRNKRTGRVERFSYVDPAAVTASLDAVVALVERVLPGWTWGVHLHGGYAEAGLSDALISAKSVHPRGRGATPALALLSAMLAALASDQTKEK